MTFTHVAAVVAGLAIIATGFVAPVQMNKSLLNGMALAVALAVAAALLIAAVRHFG
jgi:hypothetical protein